MKYRIRREETKEQTRKEVTHYGLYDNEFDALRGCIGKAERECSQASELVCIDNGVELILNDEYSTRVKYIYGGVGNDKVST